MITEVYEAFVQAGCTDTTAKKAAEALSSEQLATKGDVVKVEKELALLKKEMSIIKWMLGIIIVVLIIPILQNLL